MASSLTMAMQEVSSPSRMRALVAEWRCAGLRVALVPTMGNLHAGHLSLAELAARQADRVVCSVFVNPTQFGPGEDYVYYPRTPEADRELLAAAGVAALFMPGVEEMYPFGAAKATQMTVPDLGAILCGQKRPGHFDGVATLVVRLFNIVQPDMAVFGEKDYQQLVIVRRLVRDLHLPVEVVAAPTVREEDGLAQSSRNQYLSAKERARAPRLFAVLRELQRAVAAGNTDFRDLEHRAMRELQAVGMQPEYVEIRHAETLERAAAGDRPLVALAAARCGKARLIDNLRLD